MIAYKINAIVLYYTVMDRIIFVTLILFYK